MVIVLTICLYTVTEHPLNNLGTYMYGVRSLHTTD